MKRGVLAVLMSGLVGSFLSPASAADPVVEVSASQTTVVAGDSVKLTVGVATPTEVRIVYTFANGVVRQEKVALIPGNPYRPRIYPPIHVRVDAYAGDATTREDTVTIRVRSRVDTVPRGGVLGYSGSYAVYPRGSSPRYRATDVPGRPGRCLRHVVQRRYAVGWRTTFTSACRIEQAGKVDWTWLGKHPSGVNFRVRATFAGDSWNLANRSAWRYLRFR